MIINKLLILLFISVYFHIRLKFTIILHFTSSVFVCNDNFTSTFYNWTRTGRGGMFLTCGSSSASSYLVITWTAYCNSWTITSTKGREYWTEKWNRWNDREEGEWWGCYDWETWITRIIFHGSRICMICSHDRAFGSI